MASTASDDNLVTLKVGHDAGSKNVVIDMGQPTARLILTPEEAIAFAVLVYKQSTRIKPVTIQIR
jgi:hypothetical protein